MRPRYGISDANPSRVPSPFRYRPGCAESGHSGLPSTVRTSPNGRSSSTKGCRSRPSSIRSRSPLANQRPEMALQAIADALREGSNLGSSQQASETCQRHCSRELTAGNQNLRGYPASSAAETEARFRAFVDAVKQAGEWLGRILLTEGFLRCAGTGADVDNWDSRQNDYERLGARRSLM